MRTLAALALALGFAACGTETASYHNSLTGQACVPDQATFVPKGSKAKHPGCDANHCCIIEADGTCDNHPDAGTDVPNPP